MSSSGSTETVKTNSTGPPRLPEFYFPTSRLYRITTLELSPNGEKSRILVAHEYCAHSRRESETESRLEVSFDTELVADFLKRGREITNGMERLVAPAKTSTFYALVDLVEVPNDEDEGSTTCVLHESHFDTLEAALEGWEQSQKGLNWTIGPVSQTELLGLIVTQHPLPAGRGFLCLPFDIMQRHVTPVLTLRHRAQGYKAPIDVALSSSKRVELGISFLGWLLREVVNDLNYIVGSFRNETYMKLRSDGEGHFICLRVKSVAPKFAFDASELYFIPESSFSRLFLESYDFNLRSNPSYLMMRMKSTWQPHLNSEFYDRRAAHWTLNYLETKELAASTERLAGLGHTSTSYSTTGSTTSAADQGSRTIDSMVSDTRVETTRRVVSEEVGKSPTALARTKKKARNITTELE